MIGVPIAKLMLGNAALPSVAIVLVFNALTLWTLVSISVEWSRHGNFSLRDFGKTAINIVTNPLVGSILLGCSVGANRLENA